MEKRRRIKVLSIIALLLVIAGMTLGFAVFSSTLNISSSVTVSPDSNFFNVEFCEIDTLDFCGENRDVDWEVEYEVTNGATTLGSADAEGLNARNLGARFTKPNQSVSYKFYVHNLGEYDAY